MKNSKALDAVNHPKHYTSLGALCETCGRDIECIDLTRWMRFNTGNAVKYIWRFPEKNGLEDLHKAVWYITDEISKEGERLRARLYRQITCPGCMEGINFFHIAAKMPKHIGEAFILIMDHHRTNSASHLKMAKEFIECAILESEARNGLPSPQES